MVNQPTSRTTTRPSGPRPEGISLPDIAQILRRRKYLVIVPILLSLAFFGYQASRLEPWYESSVIVLAEQLDDYESYEPMAPVWLEDHIAAIRASVHRPTFLEDVAQRYELYEPRDGKIPSWALAELSSNIWIEQEGDDTFTIGYAGDDPRRVTEVANGIGGLFIEYMEQARQSRTGQVDRVVDAELERLAAKLEREEAELEAYKRRSGQALPENLPVLVGEVATLRSEVALKTEEIAGLEADREEAAAELRLIREHGIVERDPRVEELETTLAELRKRYTEQHPEVVRTRQMLEAARENAGPTSAAARDVEIKQIQLEARLQALDRRIASARTLRDDLESQIARYQGQIAAMPQHERQLAELMRDYEVTQESYDELLARRQYTSVSQQLASSNRGLSFRVVEPARLPGGPTGPQRSRQLLMGLIIGLTAAVGLTLLAEQMDTTYEDADDFTAATGLPVIGSIPKIPTRGHPRSGKSTRRRLPTIHDSTGTAAEQYRILAMRMRDVMDRDGTRLLMVTSGAGGEGKTTTAVNLAVALSELAPGQVLLVDGDLRRPRVRAHVDDSLAEHDPTPEGLDAILADPEGPLDRHTLHVDGLDIIASAARVDDDLAKLLPRRAPAVLDELARHYRYVVIDSPPVLPMVDGHLLAGLVDHVLFVVRARHTRSEVVHRASELFDFGKVRGVVLNDVDYRGKRYSGAYRYYERQYARADRQQATP